MEERKMTPKQKMFVLEYLKDLNATRAAIRAGYSEDTAKEIGCENLSKPNIQEAISEAMTERQTRTEVTADRVVLELAKIAFSDLKDFVNIKEGGVDIKPGDEVDGHVLAEITETVTTSGKTKKVKLHDKMKALELLGRHLAMFMDKSETKFDMNIFTGLEDLTPEEKRQMLEMALKNMVKK